MIISTSKYIKTNGDNPILPPLQMMSEAGVVTDQGDRGIIGGRAGGWGDTGARGGLATPESNNMGSHRLAFPCLLGLSPRCDPRTYGS